MNEKEALAILSIPIAAIPTLQNKNILPTAAVWAALMPDVDYKTGRMAMIRLMREKTISTLPLPGELLAIVREIKQDPSAPPNADDAWHEVLKKISPYKNTLWSHPIIHEAIERVGINNIIMGEFGVAQRFIKVYNSLLERRFIHKENELAFKLAQLDYTDLKMLQGTTTDKDDSSK